MYTLNIYSGEKVPEVAILVTEFLLLFVAESARWRFNTARSFWPIAGTDSYLLFPPDLLKP